MLWLELARGAATLGCMSFQNDFSAKTKSALGKRAGYACAICTTGTVGPSQKSLYAVTNVGVAAHITAARPGGARYDPLLSSVARSGIENAVWLCQTHAKMVDDDDVTWTVARLRAAKQAREEAAYREIGAKRERLAVDGSASHEVREFAFAVVEEFVPGYRAFIEPILADKGLGEKSELGLLLCRGGANGDVNWTVFVQPEWLRWIVAGNTAKFPIHGDVPPERIYGKLPGWPDEFFELLQAMVDTNTSLAWQRTPQGDLALGQMR